MSGVRLNYQVHLQPAFALFERLSHFKRAALLDDIGGYLVSETRQRFKTSKDPEGNDWVPSQRALDHGGKTLVDYGHLRDSITYNVFADASGVEVGSNMVYAAIHQFGGETGRKGHRFTMTARPYLGINASDEDEIDSIVAEHVQRSLQIQ